MALLSEDKIHDTLRQAYDPDRVISLYRKAVYAFGEPWTDGLMGAYRDGTLVECPDVTTRFIEVGRSRRAMNTAFISLSSTMGDQPAPEFEGIDRHTAEVRKQFMLARSNNAEDSEWGAEDSLAYVDGDGLGFGGVQVCLKTNPQTGYQRVAIEHIPAFHVFYDRHARTFGRARMVAFIKYLSPEAFAERWGEEKMVEYRRDLYNETVGSRDGGEALQVCRVIEYYDLGLWGQDPTRAVIAGNLDGEVLEREKNTFGCLPFAHYSMWHPVGARYPIGRIEMQMSTAEALNDLERALRSATSRQSFTMVDADAADPNDIEAYLNGEQDFIRFDSKSGTKMPLIHAPGADVSPTTLNYYSLLERQFSTDSGQTELDRGNQLTEKRTLGEAELLQQSSQSQTSFSLKQATAYHRRKFEIVARIAGTFDADPLEIDVFGVPYTLNDPGNPLSSVENWFKLPARIVVSEEAMRARDVKADNMARLQELQAFVSLAPMLANPQYIAEEAAKATDLDPKEAIQMPQMVPPGAPQQGQPGQKQAA